MANSKPKPDLACSAVSLRAVQTSNSFTFSGNGQEKNPKLYGTMVLMEE